MSERKIPNKDSEELYDSIGLTADEKSLLNLWRFEVSKYEVIAKKYIRYYNILSVIAIFGSMSVTFLIATNFYYNSAALLHYLALVISILVTISISFSQYFGFNNKATMYRRLAYVLRNEINLFLIGVHPYDESESSNNFKLFIINIDKIRAEINNTLGTMPDGK